MFGDGETIGDVKIDSLPRFDDSERRAGNGTLEPVTRFVRQTHGVGCSSISKGGARYTHRGRKSTSEEASANVDSGIFFIPDRNRARRQLQNVKGYAVVTYSPPANAAWELKRLGGLAPKTSTACVNLPFG
mgnify:CR=1 FL=1